MKSDVFNLDHDSLRASQPTRLSRWVGGSVARAVVVLVGCAVGIGTLGALAAGFVGNRHWFWEAPRGDISGMDILWGAIALAGVAAGILALSFVWVYLNLARQAAAQAPAPRATGAPSAMPQDPGLAMDRLINAAGLLADQEDVVRLAGIYSLVDLADEYPRLTQRCIDLLCAHLRTHLLAVPDTAEVRRRKPGKSTVRPVPDAAAHPRSQVDSVILELIREHLAHPAAECPEHPCWHGRRFDMSRAVLDSLDLSGAQLLAGTYVDLTEARVGPGLISLDGMVLEGGEMVLDDAQLTDVTITGTRITMAGGALRATSALLTQVDADLTLVASTGAGATGCLELNATHLEASHLRIGGDLGEVQLTLDGALLEHATLELRGLTVAGGSVELSDVRADAAQILIVDCALRAGTVTLERAVLISTTLEWGGTLLEGGTLTLAEAQLLSGALSFAGSHAGGTTVIVDGLLRHEACQATWGPFADIAPEPQVGLRPAGWAPAWHR